MHCCRRRRRPRRARRRREDRRRRRARPGPPRRARAGAREMRMSRVIFAIAIILTLLPLQYSVVALLPIPGAGPDLLLVAVAAVALVRGPAAGLVLGFWAGLAADLAPPADHAMGRLALAYA